MATVADFDLLRNSRQDIQKLEWSKPSVREEMTLYFGIRRAQEETHRLNIEIRRLVTFMLEEHYDYHIAITDALTRQDTAFGSILMARMKYSASISTAIARDLWRTSRLAGFSGSLKPGQSLFRSSEHGADLPKPPWFDNLSGEFSQSHWDDVDIEESMDQLVDLFENIVSTD
jgi:hypothetical protein